MFIPFDFANLSGAVQRCNLSVVLHDQDCDVRVADAVAGGRAHNEAHEAALVVR